MAENLEDSSLPMCENGVRTLTPRNAFERMVKECITKTKDMTRGCYSGEVQCSPGLGGGCCSSSRPVCCANGFNCGTSMCWNR